MTAYQGQPEILPAHHYLALSYEANKDRAKAMQHYTDLYFASANPFWQRLALKNLLRYSLEDKKYKCADHILKTARIDTKEGLDAELDWLGARVYFHLGDFKKAREHLLAVSSPEIKKNSMYHAYLEWCEGLTPVVCFPLEGDYITVLDSPDSPKNQLVLWTTEWARIYNWEAGQLREVFKLRPPKGKFFGKHIRVCDFDHDGQRDFIAVVINARNNELYFYRRNQNDFKAYRIDSIRESDVYTLWAGPLQKNGRDVILAGIGCYARNSKMLIHAPSDKKIVQIEIDPSLRKGNTDTTAMDAADLDGDGRCELILGTANWTYYDLRVYGYQSGRGFVFKHRQRLGTVMGCCALDLDRDGTAEILAIKTDTTNSEVFGEENPHGEPDGIYIFNYTSGQLIKKWSPHFCA